MGRGLGGGSGDGRGMVKGAGRLKEGGDDRGRSRGWDDGRSQVTSRAMVQGGVDGGRSHGGIPAYDNRVKIDSCEVLESGAPSADRSPRDRWDADDLDGCDEAAATVSRDVSGDPEGKLV